MARQRPFADHPRGLVVCPAGAPAMTAAIPPSPPARVQVVAREFSLAMSRPSIKAGNAIIELANFGEDAHDLRLQRIGGSKIYGWPIAQSERSRIERYASSRGATACGARSQTTVSSA